MEVSQIPRIIYDGDIEAASHLAREGMQQLNILKSLMSFNKLQQDVRRVEYIDGSRIVCRSCFGEDVVHIYVPEKEVGVEKCYIELLTYKIEGDCISNLNRIPGVWEEETCIKERGFCLTPDKECNIELKSRKHPWREKRNHHVSQCRYVYEDRNDEDEKIKRIVSLFHYDSFPTLKTIPVYKIIRVEGHQNSPNLVLKYLMTEADTDAYYYGALSKDLKTLYVSLFVEKFKFLPRTDWFLYYSKYENIDGEWKRTKAGETPIGMSFRDNALDRKGHCGCWHYADEFITHNYSKSLVNCQVVLNGWMKHGTLNEASYKTFDIETEKFIESEKVEGLHLNPVTEEFVTCKSEPGTNYFYNLPNGAPNYFIYNIFSCCCSKCPQPYTWIVATHDRDINYRYFYGGWSREYTLCSGLKTYPPLWDTFFYDGLRQHKKTAMQLVGNCPGKNRNYTCDGTAYKFDGGEMRAFLVPFTSFVYAGHAKVGTEIVQSGWEIGPPGYISGVPCHSNPPTWEWTPHLEPCGHNVESVTQAVDVNEMELLSPFEMTLQAGDQIGNTFISYDKETDYLLRGIRYKPSGGNWTWKIYARLIGHEGSPYDCHERDITNELKELLSEEYFYNIETIIFL